jgi:hypothetical protein
MINVTITKTNKPFRSVYTLKEISLCSGIYEISNSSFGNRYTFVNFVGDQYYNSIILIFDENGKCCNTIHNMNFNEHNREWDRYEYVKSDRVIQIGE